MRDNGAFNTGRQAQMMPVFASMVVHVVLIKVPKVWSFDFDAGFRVVMRSMEVRQTLEDVSGKVHTEAV